SDVQAKIDNDTRVVRAFLASQGYRAEDVDLGRFEVTDMQSREYQQQGVAARFILAQTVIVRTPDVDRVRNTTRSLNELVRQGVVLQDFQGPSYIFTGLNGVRPAMIAQATASARSGAEQFARDSGTGLGPIKSANQGSFEILARDQTSNGGDEATSLNKRVRVVTSVTYSLR
ncbi:MAG TPA: SIMPL domain-containing protein, partial [Caulobacteraceae bacterium]